MVAVSVVIPTRARAPLLARCLAALAEQDFPECDYEIVVVGDGDDPRTRATTETAAAATAARVSYLALPEARGPAAARNVGWRAAQARVIAFTDDDTVPDRDWLREGVRAFFSGVMGVWGRVIVPLSPAPSDYQREVARLANAEGATANCFYRREALIAVGGFDERFTAAWREDSDLYFRVLRRCGAVVHAPAAVVTHPARAAGWGVSLAQQRKSLFNALLYKKHPVLYRSRIQARPPYLYYGIVAALACATGAALHGLSGAAAVSAALWLLLTVALFLRRLSGTSRRRAHLMEMLLTSALIPPLSVFWRVRGAWRFRTPFL